MKRICALIIMFLLIGIESLVLAEDLGNLSSNPYNPNSTSNPYGKYGSPYSPDSINNPYGAGSPFRLDSPNNPYGSGWKIRER